MASLVKKKTTKGTTYFVQLSPGEHEQRPKISLGKCNKRNGETAKLHIESLISHINSGSVIEPTTQKWIAGLTPSVRNRLEHLNLINHVANRKISVAKWVKKYIERRTDVKEATRRKWRDVERKLKAFFQNDYIQDISVQQAKAFRGYLHGTAGLSENSIRRQIGIARQFFNDAVDADIIPKNPFRGQSVSVQANEAKFYFVTPDEIQAVLNVCPNADWRLIFGLARFGGLRCPSEVLRLKWEDVDFERLRFTVHSSKKEKHTDKGIRIVPMFPELQKLFQDSFDQARPGAVYCVDRYRKGQNLGPQAKRYIKKAGLKVWPKIFQNCRSSRETELFKQTGNIKAVCKWIGNSPTVALEHYAQVTEADMRKAAELAIIGDGKRVQNKVHEVQNQVQTTPVAASNIPHEIDEQNNEYPRFCGNSPEKTKARNSMREASFLYPVGGTGLEPVTPCL